jgi:DNA invertase Pin-like site-specific DNA recombinase
VKVIAYRRVSTDAQVDGYGLDDQERAIKDWARAHGHRVVAWCTDEGLSGSNGLDTRFALADALDLLAAGKAEGIVAKSVDRYARDLLVQEQVFAEVWRLGAQVFSTHSAESGFFVPDDPDDPSRALIRKVLGAVAEYERKMIVLRMRRGRARKADRGGFAYGSPAFGLRSVDGQLVPDETEQAAVARILALHAEGLSLRGIAAALADEDIPAKRGGLWYPRTVAAVLDRAGAR